MISLLLSVLVAHALPGAFADDPDAVVPIEKAAVATINIKGYPDWLEIGFGSLWVSNLGTGAVQRIDPETNKILAEVKVAKPCAAMIAGYGSLWVASRQDKAIVRIDPKTNTVTASVPVMVADTEASIAAGE